MEQQRGMRKTHRQGGLRQGDTLLSRFSEAKPKSNRKTPQPIRSMGHEDKTRLLVL